MFSKSMVPTIIRDLFKQQFKWTMIFIGILLILSIVRIGQSIVTGKGIDDYYSIALIAGNIFMFAIGIYCIGFMKYLVEHGVTRKDYFKGALVVALLLSAALPVITFLVYKIQKIAVSQFVIFKESSINEVPLDIDTKTSILDDIVVAFATAPHVDPDQQTVLALFVFSVTLLTYYLAGWLIGAAFQYSVVNGLVFIGLSGLILTLQDAIVRAFLKVPVMSRFEILNNLSKPILLFMIFMLIIIVTIGIQQLTRRVTVEI